MATINNCFAFALVAAAVAVAPCLHFCRIQFMLPAIRNHLRRVSFHAVVKVYEFMVEGLPAQKYRIVSPFVSHLLLKTFHTFSPTVVVSVAAVVVVVAMKNYMF